MEITYHVAVTAAEDTAGNYKALWQLYVSVSSKQEKLSELTIAHSKSRNTSDNSSRNHKPQLIATTNITEK